MTALNSSEEGLLETGLESELVFDGALLKVRRDRVCLPDGRKAQREYVCHPGAVVVLAMLDDGRLIFESQFRYPLRRVFLELPAGKIDAGEDILACAQRELREETGYVAQRWQHVGVIHPCIGYSDERIEIFIARELSHVGHALDEGEFLRVSLPTLAEVEAAVHDGRITDAKTLCALYRGLPLL